MSCECALQVEGSSAVRVEAAHRSSLLRAQSTHVAHIPADKKGEGRGAREKGEGQGNGERGKGMGRGKSI